MRMRKARPEFVGAGLESSEERKLLKGEHDCAFSKDGADELTCVT